MTNTHLNDLLTDAQAELLNAIEKLEQYVRATNDNEAEAYIVDHLKILATRDHGFLSNDLNLDDLLERVAPYDEDEDDEDDDDALDATEPPDRPGYRHLWSDTFGCYVSIPTD